MKSIQIPDDVYKKAAELAEVDHVSVDRLIAAIVNERTSDWSKLKARAERGSLEKLRVVLSKVGDTQPESVDQL
jgi:predicted CopG family antitoxin